MNILTFLGNTNLLIIFIIFLSPIIIIYKIKGSEGNIEGLKLGVAFSFFFFFYTMLSIKEDNVKKLQEGYCYKTRDQADPYYYLLIKKSAYVDEFYDRHNIVSPYSKLVKTPELQYMKKSYLLAYIKVPCPKLIIREDVLLHAKEMGYKAELLKYLQNRR